MTLTALTLLCSRGRDILRHQEMHPWLIQQLFAVAHEEEQLQLYKEIKINQHTVVSVSAVVHIQTSYLSIFYTSTFSRFNKFTPRKRVNRDILNLEYYIFGIFIHTIGIISQFSYVYAHFTHYQWAKHGLILPNKLSYYINWTDKGHPQSELLPEW